MKFLFFDKNGRVAASHNDETIYQLPDGAIQVDDEQWSKRFDLKLLNGKLTIEPEQETRDQILSRVLFSARAQRFPALLVLDVMRQDSLVVFISAQDAILASASKAELLAIQVFIQGLRDITLIDLSRFNTEAEMASAVKIAYATLVVAAPAQLKAKFKIALGL